ncbi:hydrogenase iron-sulfur subunit [Candidatus Bathyarchaeota archaeon]|nr:hydrogenase iron-sulfur subunit [Candidatus Bathyarchaeota archaeon]
MNETIEQESGNFQPRILTFACNWCSYAGADLAGVSRFQYPPSIRIIRVMCSGRIHPEMILEGFARGADGVLVTGCHIGDCHYIKGNQYTKARMELVPDLLEGIGIDSKRFKLDWVSASEGKRFSEVITSFTARVKELGPNQLKLSNY